MVGPSSTTPFAPDASDSGNDPKRLVVVVTIEYGLWTVHQGRVVTPLLRSSAAATAAADAATPTPETVRFALGDGSVIPAIDEAIAAGGLRVGGVRRVLIPPKASVSYPYVPIPEVGLGGRGSCARGAVDGG